MSMSHLTVRSSKGHGSNHYDVSGQEELLTVLDAGSESNSNFMLGNISYRLRREANWGDFILLGPEGEICRANKPSVMSRSFEMDFAGEQWVLEAHSMMGDSFDFRRGSKQSGNIQAKGFFSRHGEVTLPDSIPLPVQCFVIWLVLLMWVRSDETPGVPFIPG